MLAKFPSNVFSVCQQSALTQIESLYDDMINAYQARSMTVLLLLHMNQCNAMSFQMTKISHVVYQSFGT